MSFEILGANLYYLALGSACVAGLRARHHLFSALTVSTKCLTVSTKWTIGAVLATCLTVLGFGYGAMPVLQVNKRGRAVVKKMDFCMLEFYRRLPLNCFSRLWGKLNQVPLPLALRPAVYRSYSRLFGCNLHEVEKDLQLYRNLSEFFRRSLKSDVRPVCPTSELTSPADGQILNCGRISNGQVEQVKGLAYTLKCFLGPLHDLWSNRSALTSLRRSRTAPAELHSHVQSTHDMQYQEALKKNSENILYSIVIYLAPGDYHRFHNAADCSIKYRRHFPGHLLSVKPSVASWIKGLFCLNERVVYYGEWLHGFFSYTCVGATNVGSIDVFCDPKLRTNQRSNSDKFFDKAFRHSQDLSKGELFGEFNLGSTIALVFEAPKDFKLDVAPGDRILVGQSLGMI